MRMTPAYGLRYEFHTFDCYLDNSIVLQIKLSTKSFGRDAAEVAARGIANIADTLVEADLSDIIAGARLLLVTCVRVQRVLV